MQKRILCAVLACLLLVTSGCGAASASAAASVSASTSAAAAASAESAAQEVRTGPCYTSADEVTVDTLIARTTPTNILNEVSSFIMNIDYENTGDETLDSAMVYDLYCKTGDVIGINEHMEFTDGGFSLSYMSNDPNDRYYYATGDTGCDYNEISEEDVTALTESSLLGLDSYQCTITSIREESGSYVAELTASDAEAASAGASAMTATVTIDPETGFVTRCVAAYGSDGYTETRDFTYGNDYTLDYTPKTDNGVDAAGTPGEAAADAAASDTLSFSAQDLSGNTHTLDEFQDAKVIMVNYWEPWCSPCVGEMPDLETLYEKYQGQGLVILGVFTTEGEDEDAQAVLDDCGITYPVVRADAGLLQYARDYVPSTIFVSPDGTVLSPEGYDGAMSLENWDSIIQGYLE